MAALDFPSSPTPGQTYTANGKTWTYDSTTGSWVASNVVTVPISTGVSGLGTGVATALGVNVGSAGAFVVNGGALGTPSSGTLTSCTGLPISTGVSGLGTGVATALGVNIGSAGAPVLFNGAGGTPTSLTLTNATGLPLTTGVTGTLGVTSGGSGTSTQFTAGSVVFAGASGVYSQDNANLFWDDTNNRLGLGTSSPVQTLHIEISSSTYADNIYLKNTATAAGSWARMAFQSGTKYGYAAMTEGGDFYFFNSASGADVFATNNTERMRIDASGNVGIGTSSPSYRLHVVNNSYPQIAIQDNVTNATTKYAMIGCGHYTNAQAPAAIAYTTSTSTENLSYIGGGASQMNAATTLFFFTAANNTTAVGSERMRIDASGNCFIGTTTGAERLVVNGTTGNYALKTIAPNSTGTYYHITFSDAGTSHGSITSNGTNAAYNTTSDISLKDHIVDAASSLASILALPIRQFDWKSDGSHTDYGVVAQEAYENAPEMVTKGDLWSVDYGRITPRLIKAVQELAAEVTSLKEQLNA